jgi:type I restriction-modification system DNA methylase subunit
VKEKKESLTKSKARVKELGEVFTPAALVTEMLDKLPADCWLPDKTFLEPSCGNGNFLVQILQRKLNNNHQPLQALSTIYGVDIMKDNVVESRKRMLQIAIDGGLDWEGPDLQKSVKILKRNIRQGNTLEQSLEEIFRKDNI